MTTVESEIAVNSTADGPVKTAAVILARSDHRLNTLVRPLERLADKHPIGYARFEAIRILLFWGLGVALGAVIFVSAAIGLMILATFHFSHDLPELVLPRGNVRGYAYLGLAAWIASRSAIVLNRQRGNSIVSRFRRTWRGEKRISYWSHSPRTAETSVSKEISA